MAANISRFLENKSQIRNSSAKLSVNRGIFREVNLLFADSLELGGRFSELSPDVAGESRNS